MRRARAGGGRPRAPQQGLAGARSAPPRARMRCPSHHTLATAPPFPGSLPALHQPLMDQVKGVPGAFADRGCLVCLFRAGGTRVVSGGSKSGPQKLPWTAGESSRQPLTLQPASFGSLSSPNPQLSSEQTCPGTDLRCRSCRQPSCSFAPAVSSSLVFRSLHAAFPARSGGSDHAPLQRRAWLGRPPPRPGLASGILPQRFSRDPRPPRVGLAKRQLGLRPPPGWFATSSGDFPLATWPPACRPLAFYTGPAMWPPRRGVPHARTADSAKPPEPLPPGHE
mmetsp:Transcript_40518/g.101798  ORF Transcript_40518/g.101798 Transcript_40518/m.101798 type:complete len:280 (-) Transcript_40518:1923-2762(-)